MRGTVENLGGGLVAGHPKGMGSYTRRNWTLRHRSGTGERTVPLGPRPLSVVLGFITAPPDLSREARRQ